jgi:hypothetical protein
LFFCRICELVRRPAPDKRVTKVGVDDNIGRDPAVIRFVGAAEHFCGLLEKKQRSRCRFFNLKPAVDRQHDSQVQHVRGFSTVAHVTNLVTSGIAANTCGRRRMRTWQSLNRRF